MDRNSAANEIIDNSYSGGKTDGMYSLSNRRMTTLT